MPREYITIKEMFDPSGQEQKTWDVNEKYRNKINEQIYHGPG